ncbi:MAG: hypothetical protein M3Z14_06495, partial [Candidatus Eremiobacteraeota bacterium]|nr:hypothetical protein [Candidatus Eremiobacteraeota bacterium]
MRTGLLIALALFMGTATFGTAQAALGTRSPHCTSARTSVYGTITSVEGSTFSLNATDDLNGRYIRTTRADGNLLVRATRARINSDGLTVHPGVFAGIFGCFSGRNNFIASEVTLATSLRTYPRS